MQLEDKQIWESKQYVFKIEKFGNDHRAIIFKKIENNELEFVTIDVRKEEKILKMIKLANSILTDKNLRLRERE